MPEPTVTLWARMRELEAEVIGLTEERDAWRKMAKDDRKENARLRDELWLCVKWLESRPGWTEGDAATASSARGLLEGKDG